MDLTRIYFLNEIGGKKNQEDFIWPPPESASLNDRVFIVCDGVGGSENGEVASRIIAETVAKDMAKMESPEVSGLIVNDLLSRAREVLVQHARASRLNTDMATTFTLLVLSEKNAFIAWCGDSRVYHIRDGGILYKTSDHSLVNSLVKSGEISEEEALAHPRKNIILKAIKADDTPIDADYHLVEDVADGDYFLLCTDGLLENISDKDLRFLLTLNDKESVDLVQAFQQFCLGKTRDNYSMYLVKVKLNKKPLSYKRRIITLVLFLILLVSASAVVLNKYLTRKQQSKNDLTVIKPADSLARPYTDSAPPPFEDTNEIVITENPVTGVMTRPAEAASAPMHRPDSLQKKRPSPKKARDSPLIIFVDDSTGQVQDKQDENNNEKVMSKDSVKRPKAIMPVLKDTVRLRPIPDNKR